MSRRSHRPGPAVVILDPMNGARPRDPDVALADALLHAAAQVIIEKGLGSFSIREVARRAGVSHAAPGYHFGDSTGLLTALATEGFVTLHHEISAAAEAESDPIARIRAIGRAYVRVAMTYPAHCEVIFRDDLVNADDQKLADAGFAAFAVLEGSVRALADAHNPQLDVFAASKLCWAAMQGLVQILPKLNTIEKGRGVAPTTADDTVATFTTTLVQGFVAR
jgi:AcrR family transcriptional regulator